MKHLPIATMVNFATVIIGSLVGIFLEGVFTAEIKHIILQAIGLGTILIGIKMAWKVPDGYMLLVVFSLILGGLTGESFHIDTFLNSLSEKIRSMLSIEHAGFSNGLITAFLLFCVGSMTIVGALEEGLQGKKELLLIKASLDGFSSIALASTYGWGVLVSAFPLLLFQGSITILAVYVKTIFDQNTLDMISSVGGLLIIGIAVNILQLGVIHLENLLPSLVFAIILSKGKQFLQRENTVGSVQ